MKFTGIHTHLSWENYLMTILAAGIGILFWTLLEKHQAKKKKKKSNE